MIADDRIMFGEASFRRPLFHELTVGDSEPWMREVLKALLRVRRGLLLDVGANLGQTMLAFRSLDAHAPYIGVEPNPICVAYVDEVIRLNRLKSCTLVPVAITAHARILRLEFYQSDVADSSASIIPSFREDRPLVSSRLVPAFSGADLCEAVDLSGLAIIKIDVEGAEADVLETLTDDIASRRPLIAFELLPAYSETNTRRIETQDRVDRNLKALSYRVYRTIKTAEGKLAGFRPIKTFGVHRDITLTDYIAMPMELTKNAECKLASLVLPGDGAT